MIRSLISMLPPWALTASFCTAGLIAGVINGLLGTGGGIVVFFFLSEIYAESARYSTKDIFAMTLCSSWIMSLSSLALYISGDCFKLSDCAVFVFPAVIGGIVGALLLDRLKSGIFKKIFALLVIWAGISMIIKR